MTILIHLKIEKNEIILIYKYYLKKRFNYFKLFEINLNLN